MKPGFFQGKKFPFTPKRRKKSLGSQCNNIIDTRHDLAAFRSKLANVSWLRSYRVAPEVEGVAQVVEWRQVGEYAAVTDFVWLRRLGLVLDDAKKEGQGMCPCHQV